MPTLSYYEDGASGIRIEILLVAPLTLASTTFGTLIVCMHDHAVGGTPWPTAGTGPAENTCLSWHSRGVSSTSLPFAAKPASAQGHAECGLPAVLGL
jgi:hypothetical protein